MLKASPYIPWELSKYLVITCSIIILLTGRLPKLYSRGIIILMLLIPGCLIDESNKVQLGGIISNLLGPVSMALLLIVLGKYKLKYDEFDSILKLIWYPAISMLVYLMIKTPNYSEIDFALKANFFTSGGFGPNQVATILGLGMFLSFYAWMNKLLFSGNHSLDGIFIGLFAYQGFLSFSRGGMLIAFLSVPAYYLVFRSSITFKDVVKVRGLRPLLFFTFAIIILFSSYSIIQSITEGNLGLRYSGETNSTLSGERAKTINTITTGRYDIFIEDLALWDEYLIFGTGAGASRYLRGNGLDGISPHTEITRLLAEHGIFGLSILLILLSCYSDMIRHNKNNLYRAIQIVLFFIGMGTTLHSAMRTFVTPVLIALSMTNIIDKNK
tara:strand:+ start:1011 stop:2162 length:1152 start_codon:yes stop_codon:yes gene_type:complete